MAAANELIMIFIGLEISSIASYILAGYLRDDKRNNESALKYFLLGSFATAFFLYGVAWIYGITGINEPGRDPRVSLSAGTGNSMSLVGAVGGADVCRASRSRSRPRRSRSGRRTCIRARPTPVAAFLSAGPKAAAFAIFLRIFMTAFEPIASRWEPLVWICALLTMTIGNFAALSQTNIKRMLAYSSIAHAGYVLVALTAHSRDRHAGGDVLPGGLRVHEYRRVRRGHPLRSARASGICEIDDWRASR